MDVNRPDQSNTGSGHHESSGELMASAKVLSEAAQSAMTNKSASGIDKARCAGAAEELIDSAQKYGKIDPNSNMGQYTEKAEAYLHKVHSGGGGTTNTTSGNTSTTQYGGADDIRKEGQHEEKGSGMGDYMKMAQGVMGKKEGSDQDHEKSSSGSGGMGDYMKMAQGFVGHEEKGNKEGHEEKSSEGSGGVGDYMKMAQGFLGK